MSQSTAADSLPQLPREAVLVDSQPLEKNVLPVCGINFDEDVSLDSLCKSFLTSGFQATNLGLAIEEIRRMIKWRLSDEPVDEDDIGTSYEDPLVRAKTRCTIWLSFTSNMISCGLREVFVYLAKHRLIDVLVTSAGGVEEDFVKCLAPTYLGNFQLKGKELREKGWNRIGNLLVPNKNYCLFEDWLQPILDHLLDEQKDAFMNHPIYNNETNWVLTPSKLIDRLGKEINDEKSLYYWCHVNNIPVFCPGITDGSLGDNLYFHSYRNPGLIIDVIQDIKMINDTAVKCKKSGMIILGGGLPKHHTCNANLMRNGSDFAVFINTGQEFDGSDSGARPDEAVSWGKIRADAEPVKVYADASIVFPIVVAATFCKELKSPLPL
ncbi:deoxyhypusine synthase [Cardiosporidium cionae]|uniref:Deoxyhypusine synthase n=1 Tax=Cardiosporidium cionae TaxID=476202 RepID=A0ABQ7J8W6_9APIC|nr:deoxyhypusine synthase [Cardiosporidium cionae]|eukprot:KAF8820427.1 deoxyhypusine synthase [Cardiosporidium cionae]